ncbi:hypothetical protein GQ53DRAFT_452660 [Thozetella sp. PMI_491]|nr:hypothetical protein GQ53DRAFT_452660 [Thozetella sp. PMI_491]
MYDSKFFASIVRVLLLFSVFHAASAELIKIRQTTSTGTTSGVDNSAMLNCNAYSTIANLSTISANSTYRAAFMRSSTDGTYKSVTMLNNAQAALPALKFNVALNQQCGNASEIALVEAENNFTKGIIGEFTILEAPGIAPSGLGGPATFVSMLGIAAIWAIVTSAL